ncbi:MAG: hypothetical protein COA36_16605 [Desulfotalea sp.]|nr:MAG: hypothetical protein COA36_16605 [Desulfotalea sp.]
MFKSLFSKSVKEPEYYESIFKLPIYNWFKAMDKNNLGFLRLDSTFKPTDKVDQDNSSTAVNIWHSLINENYEEFGQDSTTLDILEQKRDIGMLEVEYVITKNKFLLTQIEIKKGKLTIFDTDKEFDYNKEIGIISKCLGYPINPKEMSVYQYNSAKNNIKNG